MMLMIRKLDWRPKQQRMRLGIKTNIVHKGSTRPSPKTPQTLAGLLLSGANFSSLRAAGELKMAEAR